MNIFSTEGRIGRGTYFLWMLVIGFLMAGISFLPFPFLQEPNVGYVLGLILGFVCVFPSVRRLHDLNKSGWVLLLGFIPVLNIILPLFLLFVKGTDGKNAYGESPNRSHPESGEAMDAQKSTVSGLAPNIEVASEIVGGDENDFYDQVAEEIENDNMVRSVWTRAFAEADGDENRAKAIYIKLRVSHISDENKRNCENARRVVIAEKYGGDKNADLCDPVNERWVRNKYSNGDVTMSDKKTGLMWIFDPSVCGKMSWTDAVVYSEDLSYAGYSDWRLPTKEELMDQFSQRNNFNGISNQLYWSGTSCNTNIARDVSMSVGSSCGDKKSKVFNVWPVRGRGQSA